jgi:hypothetical protein
MNVRFGLRLQLVDATLYLYNKKKECWKWLTEQESIIQKTKNPRYGIVGNEVNHYKLHLSVMLNHNSHISDIFICSSLTTTLDSNRTS